MMDNIIHIDPKATSRIMDELRNLICDLLAEEFDRRANEMGSQPTTLRKAHTHGAIQGTWEQAARLARELKQQRIVR